ncbi:MAG: Maf family nucleotide pyrophosphatase [Bacteroidales bacterium]|nr:Maf family nucleotide pyrophosphatase [Bacteroidales bacterium]
MRIVLASASPRRRQLIATLGWPVSVVQVQASETVPQGLPVSQVAEQIAQQKTAAFDHSQLEPDQLLVTADTIVALDGQVLGKPANRSSAIAMLQKLSGHRHTVYTGVCLSQAGRQTSFTESTEVYFKPLTTSVIEYYVDNYKPYDKAGAYGIQEWIGYVGVSRIEGCYYNVMGLPTARLYDEIVRFYPEATVPQQL